jgi:hypothetical protein
MVQLASSSTAGTNGPILSWRLVQNKEAGQVMDHPYLMSILLRASDAIAEVHAGLRGIRSA